MHHSNSNPNGGLDGKPHRLRFLPKDRQEWRPFPPCRKWPCAYRQGAQTLRRETGKRTPRSQGDDRDSPRLRMPETPRRGEHSGLLEEKVPGGGGAETFRNTPGAVGHAGVGRLTLQTGTWVMRRPACRHIDDKSRIAPFSRLTIFSNQNVEKIVGRERGVF